MLRCQTPQLPPLPSGSTMPQHCLTFPHLRTQRVGTPSLLPHTRPATPGVTATLGDRGGGCWLRPLVHPLELQGVAGDEISHRRARAQPAVQLEDVPEAGSLVPCGDKSPVSCPLSLPPPAAQRRVTLPCLVT